MMMRHSLLSSTVVVLVAYAGMAIPAHSQEKEDAEKTRATVITLIETLVKNGNMTRSQADTMMREAEARARTRILAMPAPEETPDGKKVVRVPYIPESVKTEMREQIKAEVLADTNKPKAGSLLMGEAGKRMKLVGDIRVRYEGNLMQNNTATNAVGNNGQRDYTRGPDFSPANEKINTPLGESFDPTKDTQRARVRVRLGLIGDLNDEWSYGVGIATGSGTSGAVSTNQTLGQGSSSAPGFFNKYPVQFDRAYLRYQPSAAVEVNTGRFKNPFVGTELVWDEDLSFEGIAASAKAPVNDFSDVFATVGWFPLTTRTPGKSLARSLVGGQLGWERSIGLKSNKFKLAAGLYKYNGIEGQPESVGYTAANANYLSSEYPAGIRQRGNTLVKINSQQTITDAGVSSQQCTTSNYMDCANTWGLASSFNELNITTSLDLAEFDPVHVVLTLDMVKNLGYDAQATSKRTGVQFLDVDTFGFLTSIKLGSTSIKQRGDWRLSAAYRRIGSDAVLDAFTDSDFGMGGTNNKGFMLNYSMGIAPNTWVSAKWMSSDLLDAMVPNATGGTNAKTKFSVDSLFFDLNTRF